MAKLFEVFDGEFNEADLHAVIMAEDILEQQGFSVKKVNITFMMVRPTF